MGGEPSLQSADWIIVGVYLLLTLLVGILLKRRAETDRESFFLAGRALPWWWAGLSTAATTFAADTPLAVTGIVAHKGLAGNWIWLSWIGVHAAVVVYFAGGWNRSRVITDAELIELRYDGRAAAWLRGLRAALYGLVYNAIILGWVMRAMVKIVTPFFHWERWTPSLIRAVQRVWPSRSTLGDPGQGLTIIALLLLVGTYSSLGGIRGVITTDLLQLAIALFGSVALAVAAWRAVGGRAQLTRALERQYGRRQRYLRLFDRPSASAGSGPLLGLYLLVQSYANVPADGGGYLMQRLNTTATPREARRASLLFLLLQYLLRTWPWFVVAVAALVLIPIGQESTALGGGIAAQVAGDRELAYPVLMGHLLPPSLLGLMVTSLLAAFMSTLDTHLNWGASYIVNDFYVRLRPDASGREQVRTARLAVVGYVVAAVLVSFQIETIERAWRWVAALGAALGAATALRWVWWRVNAAGELGAMVAGLAASMLLGPVLGIAYEHKLVGIAAASLGGLAAGMLWGPRTDEAVVVSFAARTRAQGFWPDRTARQATAELCRTALRWVALVGGVLALLGAGTSALFRGTLVLSAMLAFAGVAALWWAVREVA